MTYDEKGKFTRVEGWPAKSLYLQVIGANLTGADLSRAILTGVNLTTAILANANLSEADLTGADLTEAVDAIKKAMQ